ncbi:type 1 periplasmic binding fold superfamily protein [Tenacibaculum amylolyticum]|uniref:type 1 periplasmic binding fold superfamily protein n=1 Tax=Tenacibaculum amylolyticum TaxID=104269 RepID=UPI003892E64A
MKSIKLLAILFIAAITFSSCSDDETPAPVNEEEVITTMVVTLTPAGGGNAITLTSKDLDGDGPNAPVLTYSPDPATLTMGATYNGSIQLWNETEDPAENVNDEIVAEADDHQFFYSASTIAANFAYAGANDSNGNPVGINFTVTPTSAGTGTMTFILRHEPNKAGANVSTGDITNAGGETDIEVSFAVTVNQPL